MKPRHFLATLDAARIEAAIGRAEARTSGEIRVLVDHRAVPDPVAAARREFLRLGMQRTAARNAVLLFVAPASQTFALVGDEGVHARCGDAFWREVAAGMEERFRAGDPTAAICEGIDRAGTLLAAEFPRREDDRNELPDRIVEKD
jgi:uncharacterized membrane protein